MRGGIGKSDYFLMNDCVSFLEPRLLKVPHHDALFTQSASFLDIDADGDLDFLKGSWFFVIPRTLPSRQSTNYLALNDGHATFEQRPLDEIRGETLATLLSDINADGMPDMVIGNDFMEPDIFYLGEESGSFRQLAAGDVVPVSTLATMSIDSGDFNNDLIPDLYLAGKVNNFSQRRGQDGVRDAHDINMLRRLVQEENDRFGQQYCQTVAEPVESARCREFIALRDIVRTKDLESCNTLDTEREKDECYVTVGLIYAQVRKDAAFCGRIPAARFPEHHAICDAYFSYYRASEHRPAGYQYLDQGAIPQQQQGNLLLRGSGDGSFADITRDAGVFDGVWAWTAKFADLDNDEWQDIYVANGWWLENQLYPNRFFHNKGGGKFEAEEKAFGIDNPRKQSAYTHIDIDNDGDLDLMTRSMDGSVDAYINNEAKNNLIVFEVRDAIGNAFGIGTRVYVYYGENGERAQYREFKAGSGFLSFDAPLIHFGLGKYEAITRVEIHWPDGETDVLDHPLEANRKYILHRRTAADRHIGQETDG